MDEARRRMLANRLCAIHKNAHEHSENQELARRELPAIADLELMSCRQYTMRAEIYKKLGEPEKAARDYELAEQWRENELAE